MNSNKRFICYLSYIVLLILSNHYTNAMTFDYEKILEKKYQSSLEFIFDPEVDYDLHIAENDPIRKNYHKFKETNLNLMNGARMKCYTPSKIRKSVEIDPNKSLITKISDEFAYLFLGESKNLCYNSNIKEWFYKLCPSKLATQVLTYKKKNETTGVEYIESWLLGQRESPTFNKTEIYIRETNDTTSQNIQPNPFVITEDRVSKSF